VRQLYPQEVIVASDPKEQSEMTRRAFASRLGLGTMAAAVLSTDALRPRSTSAAPLVGGRVIGANDRLVFASIGIRGQGNSLKRGFARLKNVEIKTLCDIDANLAGERINDKRLADVATFKPGFQQDLRRVMEDKDIDGVIIATPNHCTRSRPSGRSRPASTSTSRSPPPTPCGKAARWSKRPPSTTRSSRSAR
jgi:hypothetical protein